jgi:hypothetical protein
LAILIAGLDRLRAAGREEDPVAGRRGAISQSFSASSAVGVEVKFIALA